MSKYVTERMDSMSANRLLYFDGGHVSSRAWKLERGRRNLSGLGTDVIEDVDVLISVRNVLLRYVRLL